MLASTITASARAQPASTALGAAAVIGWLSSRRASNSALIAEISASTASTCSPRARPARTTATSAEGTYLDRPRPAARAVK